LADVDLSIETKQTPQQDVKSNAAQNDEQHNAAVRQQNHKKRKRKTLYENHLFKLKEKGKKM